ncbi:Brp/Blh family beta-carotene 15,15'-dioxygenase [Flavobacterium sp. LS2P90]|uniref:Probable beta-carotene 15,15'-dioxygenase n=1 Tax=Flavobacterium xylosi TaxID=3230415 RepID=A0ABW6HSZ9_9FLAO
MSKYLNISIVVSFFGLWIDSFFSHRVQIIIGFILIFSFGILHGANDLLLIENINSKKKAFPFLKIVGYYVLVVFVGALLFYVISWLALLLFLVVSAYHFGEQQWQNLKPLVSKWFSVLFQFFYGAIILFLLFAFHLYEVQKIVFQIIKISIDTHYIITALKIIVGFLILLGAYLYWKFEIARKQLLAETLYLLLFIIIFKSSSLIWGFALYFVLWHSIPSIIDQIKFLHGKYSFPLFVTYCRSAMLYWGISILGISVLYFVFNQEELFNGLFFSFLAAITFPHALVITKIFSGKEQE